jgi:hypothetical protein
MTSNMSIEKRFNKRQRQSENLFCTYKLINYAHKAKDKFHFN